MFAMPPAIVQNVSAATSAIHASIRAGETTVLGICRFVPDATSKEGEFPGYPMGVSNYLSVAVPQKFQDDFQYNTWGPYWADNTKTEILQQPQHGKLETSDMHNPGDIVYYPKKGFIGQDRVVVLATNTLPDGSPVRAKLIFFLNVIPIADIPLGGGGQYVKSNTKYCPTGKETWTISTAPSGESSYHSQPQGSFPFGSPSMNVSYGDSSGFAVGEEKSFGGAASIVLDTNAAGYGGFVDSTPADSTDFLPTSNPAEWIAKVGSPAYGTMDLYTEKKGAISTAGVAEHTGDLSAEP